MVLVVREVVELAREPVEVGAGVAVMDKEAPPSGTIWKA